MGAIGSAAPWFLTGWAHEVEIEYMIDTVCQVTILSTTVFERMCSVDPAVRSALRPCRRWLVSADSSPLIVQGQLELNIVFPGLCCDMLFVVANIGSDGLWAQRPYSPTYHTNWICVVGRWMVYVAVTPTSIDTRPRWTLNDIGGDPSGQ